MSRYVETGTLELHFASGRHAQLGDGTHPHVVARLTDDRAPWALLLDPDLRTGELYTDGRLVLEQGTIYQFLELVLRGAKKVSPSPPVRVLDRVRLNIRRALQRNGIERAKRNVEHHYDLDERLYRLFLDDDWLYSCAYFETPQHTLDEAQLAKKRHITAKLLVEPHHRVLDIGSGWGGLALYLSEIGHAAHVQGITLSEEQRRRAAARAVTSGLADRVAFSLQDYRTVEETFDRIVSVGMFEHVGIGNYDTFFRTCRQRLTHDGVMLLHFIGNSDVPDFTNPWMLRYIFPGGHIASLSEVLPAVERSGLVVTDIEVLRLHYAQTLRAWRDRFMARRDEALELYDERFCRMWEYYLSMSETAFRYEDVVVFQIQMAVRQHDVPLTRDYISARTAELLRRERQRHLPGA